jgi:hypothetical protein
MKSHLELFSSYKIKSISLKNILNKYTKKEDNIVIKIDAQGSETQILKNFLSIKDSLKRNILNIFYEVNDLGLYEQKKILNNLIPFYTLYDLDNNEINISSIKNYLKQIVNLKKIQVDVN